MTVAGRSALTAVAFRSAELGKHASLLKGLLDCMISVTLSQVRRYLILRCHMSTCANALPCMRRSAKYMLFSVVLPALLVLAVILTSCRCGIAHRAPRRGVMIYVFERQIVVRKQMCHASQKFGRERAGHYVAGFPNQPRRRFKMIGIVGAVALARSYTTRDGSDGGAAAGGGGSGAPAGCVPRCSMC